MKISYYVNVPLNDDEHKALAVLAKREGRSKGRQLSVLAISKLRALGLLESPNKAQSKPIIH